ncbi:MAG: MBL fold metallo-hydrolase [Chryseobacterium sp.]|nr:MAG: MBL fold metallo-hydrolase [Chryseobacterium sp.]
MKQSDDNRLIPMTSINSGKLREVAPDVAYYTDQIVNVIMLGHTDGPWMLVDIGVPKSADGIIKAAAERFGADNPPRAIVLTHGHFDHVGNIVALEQEWNVPVFAHPLEFPFLTGQRAYPEPDTSVQGGILAKISSLYPNEPVDIRERLHELPQDHSVPELPEWRWIHVPGHSPGQIALFRDRDRLLISADAFITVRQDSLYRVLVQKEEVCGPPVYLTTDWNAAFTSASTLADLMPETVIPGHGSAMSGDELRTGLRKLITDWDELAVPEHGKWVHDKE